MKKYILILVCVLGFVSQLEAQTFNFTIKDRDGNPQEVSSTGTISETPYRLNVFLDNGYVLSIYNGAAEWGEPSWNGMYVYDPMGWNGDWKAIGFYRPRNPTGNVYTDNWNDLVAENELYPYHNWGVVENYNQEGGISGVFGQDSIATLVSLGFTGTVAPPVSPFVTQAQELSVGLVFEDGRWRPEE